MFETLSSYKCRIGDFNLYGFDDNGCEWFIPFNGVDGVFNGATSTLSTSTKVWTDGYFTNRAVHAGRTVKLTGYIHGDCFDDILTSWERFKAHLPFRETAEFTTTLRGISRLMYVEYQGEPLISSEGNSLGKFSLTLVSRDALTYTPGDPLTGTTKLPSSEGGMTFPYVFTTAQTAANLTTRWTGTPDASTSTLSQDGQVVATNLDTTADCLQVKRINADAIKAAQNTDGTWTYTTIDAFFRWIIPVSAVPPVVGMIVFAQWAETEVQYSGTDGPIVASGPGWVAFAVDDKLKMGINFPVGVSFTLLHSGLYPAADWQAMQALGIDWFDGDTYPRRWVFDEHVVSGSVNLLTSGSGNSPVTIRFNGDVTNPQVLHVESGKILAYTGRIGAGHYVLFDGQSRQVLIDGATPARGAATRLEWFTAQQGVNTFQYSAERGEDTSTMTVSFREGWL